MRRPFQVNKWLVSLSTSPAVRTRMILFPFAGAGPAAFADWADHLPPGIELFAVQLPGRAARFTEPLRRRLLPMVDELVPALDPHLAGGTVFFGHSMGALLAFETARRLRVSGFLPRHLHVSGCPSPRLRSLYPRIHDLPEEPFIEEIRKLAGTPREVLETPELLALVLPALQADFQAAETYVYVPAPPLRCPIHVYGGDRDPWARPADLAAWKEETVARFSLTIFSGDHFFFHRSPASFLAAIRRRLEEA